MIFLYIFYCLRQRVAPWLYFQLNAQCFDTQKKIFSKLLIDQEIPDVWRLPQQVLDKDTHIDDYPVFVKPEWGQNAYGIKVVHSEEELQIFKNQNPKNYIVQQCASEALEIEIFYIRHAPAPSKIKDEKYSCATKTDDYAILKVVQVINTEDETYPINSIHNANTYYKDISKAFSHEDKQCLWKHIKTMGDFRFARVGVKANTQKDLLQGKFHVIEINLFAPMPLHLLDPQVGTKEKHQFIYHSMQALASITGTIPKKQKRKHIFFYMVKRHYQIQS